MRQLGKRIDRLETALRERRGSCPVCHGQRGLDIFRQDGPAAEPVPDQVAGPCPTCGLEPDTVIELLVRSREEAAAAVRADDRF